MPLFEGAGRGRTGHPRPGETKGTTRTLEEQTLEPRQSHSLFRGKNSIETSTE